MSGDRWTRWGWVAVLAALAYVVKHGVTYGVGDHDEMLPQLLRMIDPDLYPRDWFVVEQGGRFTVRTPFLWLLRVVTLGMPVGAAVGAVQAAGLIGVGAGAYRLARALGVERPAAALATVVAVGVVPTWALSGSALAFRALVPEMLAWAVALPAIVWVIEGKTIRGGALLGAAAYLQLLVGALTTGVLGLAIVLGALGGTHRDRWATALRLGGAALVVALPLVLFVLHDRSTGPPIPADGLSSYFLIAELRLPHHYLPSLFGADRWLRFAMVAVPGVAALAWLRRRGQPLVFVERFGLAVAFVCGVAWPLVEAADSLFVAQLQVFKTTVLLVTLLVVAIAAAGLDALPDRLRSLADAPFRHPGWAWGGTLGAVALAGLLVAAGPLRAKAGPLVRDADEVAVEAWARANTPIDALFVVPPSNTSFRTASRRSVAITYKPTSFQEGSTHVWYDRLLTVAPAAADSPTRGFAFAEALDAAYAANRVTDWQRLAEAWGVDYALVDREGTPTPPDAEPVFASGRWAIVPLRAR
ncbi:DUF6798 domain-containing protein [Rubrivirga sp. IMCC43871]|uniref:DUF6798 domain-containing protein n=1 Tax=Rubrivirga sp. IMCC43871 TaxID=3391575 RepID=UPI00398FA557